MQRNSETHRGLLSNAIFGMYAAVEAENVASIEYHGWSTISDVQSMCAVDDAESVAVKAGNQN